MRASKKELMDKLGIGYELGPYETCPWSCYDSAIGKTCSAEARMDPDGKELEAEIQMMYDNPPEGIPPMEQVFLLKARPASDTEWEIIDFRLSGEAGDKEIYDWQGKCCDFFMAVIQELQADTIPDIDDLIDFHFHSRERLGDQRQGGGGKSPKMRGAQVMGMKKGGAF